MTQSISLNEKKTKKEWLPTLTCLTLTLIMILMSSQIKKGIYRGISLCLTSLVPTLFPFFILSDIWSCYFRVNNKSLTSKLFSSIFHINGRAVIAFLCGIVCGFPLGVKTAVDLYNNKCLSKEETETICGFINNPSMAFVISGIGLGIYRDASVGIILYLSVVISAIIIGFAFRPKHKKSLNSDVILGQSFNLVNSIKYAGVASLTVSSYVIFFSGILSPLAFFIDNDIACAIISCFTEISCAVTYIAKASAISTELRLSLTGFALGFSGLSVHLQAFTFMHKEIRKKKYLLMKLIQGIICSLLTAFFYHLFI